MTGKITKRALVPKGQNMKSAVAELVALPDRMRIYRWAALIEGQDWRAVDGPVDRFVNISLNRVERHELDRPIRQNARPCPRFVFADLNQIGMQQSCSPILRILQLLFRSRDEQPTRRPESAQITHCFT